MNSNLMLLVLLMIMTSCTLTQEVRIQNFANKQVSLIDCTGTMREELTPGETWRYPVVRTVTSGLSTPLIEFSTQHSRFKFSVRIDKLYYEFPEFYTMRMTYWSDRSWIGQIIFLEASDLIIRENAYPLFVFQGQQIELLPEE